MTRHLDNELVLLTEQLCDALIARGLDHISIFASGSVCVATDANPVSTYGRNGILEALARLDERTSAERLLETLY